MNTSIPSISIITATYNAENDLPVLMNSLRQQTDRSFEWIVIDGASTDSTVGILRDSSDVVTKWISEPDFGIYEALNKGLKLASGEYYLVIGSDDTLEPDAIANFGNAAIMSQADVITASVVVGDEITKVCGGPAWLTGQFAYVAAHSVGTLFRRDLHKHFGLYSKKYPIAADAHFIKRVCQGGASIFHADFVACSFGRNGVSSIDVAGALSESFRVQLETEQKLPQVLLHILRLLKNIRRL